MRFTYRHSYQSAWPRQLGSSPSERPRVSQETVTDASAAVIPDVFQCPRLKHREGQLLRRGLTSVGFYLLTNLAPGKYRLRAEKAGFNPTFRNR